MKLEDVRFKMNVIVTKGFYEGCVGRVKCETAFYDRVNVTLYTKGSNVISRLFNEFRRFDHVFNIDEIEPL